MAVSTTAQSASTSSVSGGVGGGGSSNTIPHHHQQNSDTDSDSSNGSGSSSSKGRRHSRSKKVAFKQGIMPPTYKGQTPPTANVSKSGALINKSVLRSSSAKPAASKTSNKQTDDVEAD